MRLITEAQYDDACKVGRRIGEDVGEIQIQGDEGAILPTTNIDYLLVKCAAESLLNN
jgi:hypothetical protein